MLTKLISPFKEFGWFAGFTYLLNRVLRRLSSNMGLFHYELMVQPIHEKALLPKKMGANLSMREITKDDPEMQYMLAPKEMLELRFQQDAKCLGCFRHDKFLGYIWICFERYREDEVRADYSLEPRAVSVFDFDLYVFPDSRLGIGFAGIWDGANRYLRERDIKYTFSRLTRFNTESRVSHKHLGWARVAQAVFLKAWDLEVMVATISPYIHFSARQSNRVRLTLNPEVLQSKTKPN